MLFSLYCLHEVDLRKSNSQVVSTYEPDPLGLNGVQGGPGLARLRRACLDMTYSVYNIQQITNLLFCQRPPLLEGKKCQGKTPMKTFMENPPWAKEKMLCIGSEDRLSIAA